MLFDIFKLSLFGALLSLDRRAAFQTMISRPIITAPLISLLFGNIDSINYGIMLGVMFEFLWLCDLPVGSYLPPDDNFAVIIITSLTMLEINVPSECRNEGPLLNLSILLLIPLVYLGRAIDKWIRNFNVRFSRNTDAECENLEFGKIERKNILGLLTCYLINFTFIFITLALAVSLFNYVERTVPFLSGESFELAWFHSIIGGIILGPGIIFIGIIAVIAANRDKKFLKISLWSFLIFYIIFVTLDKIFI